MAYQFLKSVELEFTQVLYLYCNATQEIIQNILSGDFEPSDIPHLKFRKYGDTTGQPKVGVRWTGEHSNFNIQGTYEAKLTPADNKIMAHQFNGSLDDIEEYVAVPKSSNSTVTISIGRVISEGEKFVLVAPTNFMTLGDFEIYGKTSDDSFVKVSGNWSRYSDERQSITYTQREIGQPWDNIQTVEYTNDNKLIPLYMGQSTGELIWRSSSEVIINFKIAKDIYGAKKYLLYGDESGLIDEGDEPEEPKQLYEKLYFKQEYWYGVIDSTTDPNSHYVDGYYDENYHFNSADMDADFYAKYQFNLRDKPNLCLYIGTPSTPVSTHASEFFNARPHLYFLERSGVVYADEELPIFLSNMGVSHRYKSMNNIAGMTPIGLAPRYNTSLGEIHGIPDNILYGANLETNIPIFRTRELAEKYLAGEIGKDQAINQVGPNIEQGNLTGHQLISHTYNNVDADAVCSECLCCSSGAFQEFFDKLFDTTNRQDILAGLELYGTDVASFIVDTFAVPFDYSVFQDTSPTNRLTFGSYSQTFDSSFNKTTKLNPKIVPAFSCSIVGGFNDWRDWQSEYYLSLPYVGKNIHINKEVYLYHLLECDVSVDVRTGQIKYFIKCDGVVTDTYEGVCRVSMPIQTTNNYSYSREKLDACASVLGGSVGAVMNAASGNPTGIIGNVTGVVDGLLDLDKVNPINTTGNCSPSNAWNDPLECYLIVQTPEFEYSQNIPNTYGYPANYVSNIGNQSGYIECRSVFLKSSATETEQNEILQLLANGIII